MSTATSLSLPLRVLLQRVADVDPGKVPYHQMRFALSRIMREFGRHRRASP